jgi:hypothetical protein
MRTTFVWCPEAGRVVETWQAARYRGRNGGPPLLDSPAVWGTMPETRHIIDGRIYDSREKYNRVTRAHGATEVGKREMAKVQERGNRPVEVGTGIERDIKRALQQQGHF